MKIKANLDFFHNGELVKQSQVIDLPKEEALGIVSKGFAFVINKQDLEEKTRIPKPDGK